LSALLDEIKSASTVLDQRNATIAQLGKRVENRKPPAGINGGTGRATSLTFTREQRAEIAKKATKN